jgi:hypothetical protein
MAPELAEDLHAAAEAARALAADGQHVTGVIPAEPADGLRLYLCAYGEGDELSWLVLDDAGRPLGDRALVRDAASIIAMCELAEETAGGGDVPRLRQQLAELRDTEGPDGIEDAEAAAEALERAIATEPRVASPAYLDALGQAATRLELALGQVGASPFAEAMRVGMGAVAELADDVERRYRRALG